MIPAKILIQAMSDETLWTFVIGGVDEEYLYEMARREMHRRLAERGHTRWVKGQDDKARNVLSIAV